MLRLVLTILSLVVLGSSAEAAGRRSRTSYNSTTSQSSNGNYYHTESYKSNTPRETGPANAALNEVNAARARRGLPPFIQDNLLAVAAQRIAEYRAQHHIHGHISGGMGVFGFLPPGASADAGGCGA